MSRKLKWERRPRTHSQASCSRQPKLYLLPGPFGCFIHRFLSACAHSPAHCEQDVLAEAID